MYLIPKAYENSSINISEASLLRPYKDLGPSMLNSSLIYLIILIFLSIFLFIILSIDFIEYTLA